MKITIKVPNHNFSDEIDVSEMKTLKQIGELVNKNLDTNESFNYLYNCELFDGDKDIEDLQLKDGSILNCILTAKSLKRKLNENVESMVYKGAAFKKSCLFNDVNYTDQNLWKNLRIDEIKESIDSIVSSNNETIEQLLSDKNVRYILDNGTVFSSLLSSNPKLVEMIEKNPEKALFISDLSQFQWVKSELKSNDNVEKLLEDYTDRRSSIIDSKRYIQMSETFSKMSELDETLDEDKYNPKTLNTITRSSYGLKLMQILSENEDLSQTVLKNCPYGSHLTTDETKEIQAILPEVALLYKRATEESNEAGDVINYLKNNPIEMDECALERLEKITGRIPTNISEINQSDDSNVNGVVSTVMKLIVEETCGENNDRVYNNELEKLKQLGFKDNDETYNILSSEYGNLARTISRLS